MTDYFIKFDTLARAKTVLTNLGLWETLAATANSPAVDRPRQTTFVLDPAAPRLARRFQGTIVTVHPIGGNGIWMKQTGTKVVNGMTVPTYTQQAGRYMLLRLQGDKVKLPATPPTGVTYMPLEQSPVRFA